ncbi:MAG: TonB-dependent receptor plug domain-containing protein [Desulfamplus sp.]|nr:TonB-dependent receptor plug domain-containing protein [Desulfamplus sp.]
MEWVMKQFVLKQFVFIVMFFCILLSSTVKADSSSYKTDDDADSLSLMALEDLMQVEIETAGKVSEKIGKIPASVVLITRKDIERYGYTTFDDILQHVSGLYRLDFYSIAGPAYGVRGHLSPGTTNRDIIILVNGIRQINDYDTSYYISNIAVPVEAIDRVEIIRGPESAVYGSGAFFGVINIITNEVVQEKGSASYVSFSGGTPHANRMFGRTSYINENGKVVINAGSSQDGGLDVPYSRLESKFMGDEAGFTTDGRLENSQRYFELSGNYKKISFDLTSSATDYEGFLVNPTVRSGSETTLESTRLRMGYKNNLSEKFYLNSKLTYIYNKSHGDYDSMFVNDPWNMQQEESTAYEGEITLQWKASEYFDITNGIYFRYLPEMSSISNIPSLSQVPSLQKATQRLQSDEALTNRSVFSQLNYYPNEHWKFVAGLMLEQILGYGVFAEYGRNPVEYRSFTPYYEDQDLSVIPRLAAIYTPNENHIFKFMTVPS